MSATQVLENAKEHMEKSLDFMMHEFAAIRTGKASPALAENIDIHAYGSHMKLKQLAMITTPEPRLILIQPFDLSTVKDIEKGIQESNLGINPTVEGKFIRLHLPELSEERRKDLVKTIGKVAEESRVRIRSNRRDAIDKLKKLQKESTITEDELTRHEKEIQKLTDKFVADVEVHVRNKEQELMTL